MRLSFNPIRHHALAKKGRQQKQPGRTRRKHRFRPVVIVPLLEIIREREERKAPKPDDGHKQIILPEGGPGQENPTPTEDKPERGVVIIPL